ncbi:MAG TPA: hypothetical protein VEA17_17275, partial [Bordetella sp.]|nr:hypothetical protein [Bordetella sp.]
HSGLLEIQKNHACGHGFSILHRLARQRPAQAGAMPEAGNNEHQWAHKQNTFGAPENMNKYFVVFCIGSHSSQLPLMIVMSSSFLSCRSSAALRRAACWAPAGQDRAEPDPHHGHGQHPA